MFHLKRFSQHSAVSDVLNENMEAIVEQRYRINGLGSSSPSFTSFIVVVSPFFLLTWTLRVECYLFLFFSFSVGSLCGQVRKRHPWGDAKLVKVTK